MRNTKRHQPGFTLIEVMIAIVIMGITMLAVAMVMRTSVRSWRVGHAMAEMTQTTRIAQDVVLRDLNNIFYMSESDYNDSFRRSIDEFGQMLDENEPIDPGMSLDGYRKRKRDRDRSSRSERDQEEKLEELIDSRRIADITPPIDLSMSLTDGGKADSITFVRRHDPRWIEEPETWGLRRVTYAVKDGTLYRSEQDPFGLGEGMNLRFNGAPAMQRLLKMFQRPSGKRPNAFAAGLLPEAINIEEPLCENVEVFDMTVGYFRTNAWHEVNNWQSGSSQYRGLPRLGTAEFDEMTLGMTMSELNNVTTLFGVLGNRAEQPDDLPAYIAVQLGVRLEGGKGRLYSYTFYHSFQQSQETDQQILLPDGREIRREPRNERGRRGRDGNRRERGGRGSGSGREARSR